jgi:hypothetical protein
MVKVAGLETDRLALEAVINFLPLTLGTDQLYLFHLLTSPARPFSPSHEAQFMAVVAVDRPQSLLVRRDRVEVLPALQTESHSAGRVLDVHLSSPVATHAPVPRQDDCEFVFELTDIVVDADILALEAEIECAGGTGLGAVLGAFTHGAVSLEGLRVVGKGSAAVALLLVIDQPHKMVIVPLVRQSLNAVLADAEVAGLVVVDARVEDRGVHAADVADVLQVAILEKREIVTHGAPFLGTGRHPALDAILLIAFTANRTTQLLLSALRANRRNHLVVLPNEELQVVLQRTPVFLLQPTPHPLRGRSERTQQVVTLEGSHRGDRQLAQRTEGAAELEVERGEFDCEEGFTASVWTAIADVLGLGDALDAEDLLTRPAALHQLSTQVETDPALEVLQGGTVLYVVFSIETYRLHARRVRLEL